MAIHDRISTSEAFALLLDACPGARADWEEHIIDCEGEADDSPFLGAAVFARHVVELKAAGKTETFPAVFKLIERLIVEGDGKVREIATIGFLEDIQNISSWREFGNEVFVQFLGPRSLSEWNELIKIWEGKDSLADVLRNELKGK